MFNIVNNKEYVRGEIKMAAYIFVKLDQETSKMFYVVHLDPKGWIPQWIVNISAAEQGLVAGNVGKNIQIIKDFLQNKKQIMVNNNEESDIKQE